MSLNKSWRVALQSLSLGEDSCFPTQEIEKFLQDDLAIELRVMLIEQMYIAANKHAPQEDPAAFESKIKLILELGVAESLRSGQISRECLALIGRTPSLLRFVIKIKRSRKLEFNN